MRPVREDRYQVKLGLIIALVFTTVGIVTAFGTALSIPLSVILTIGAARIVYILGIWLLYVHVAPRFSNKFLTLVVFLILSGIAVQPLVHINYWINDLTGFYYPTFENPTTPEEGRDHIFYSYIWRALLTAVLVFLIRYREDLLFEKQYYLLAHEQTKNENLRNQLDTLKQQLDPHFLFNTLNGLKILIKKDPDKAAQYAIEVASVYRYLLRHNRNTTVTLEEELKFLEAYSSLLQLRFEDNFELRVNVEKVSLQRMVFPMSLQLLVENAVKHNVVTNQDKLVVEIYSSGNMITVQNIVKLRSTTDGISRYGLSNLNSLYQLHYQQELTISMTNTLFKVSLPLL